METATWESLIEELFAPIQPSDLLIWEFESQCSLPDTMCQSRQSNSSVYQGRYSAEFTQSRSGGPIVLYFCETCAKSYLSFMQLRRHVNEDHVAPKTGLLRSLSYRASRIRGHLDKHKKRQVLTPEHICGGPGEQWGCQRHFATAADFWQHFQTEMGRDCIDLFLLKGSVDMRQVQLPHSSAKENGQHRFNDKTHNLLPAALLSKYPALRDCARCISPVHSDGESCDRMLGSERERHHGSDRNTTSTACELQHVHSEASVQGPCEPSEADKLCKCQTRCTCTSLIAKPHGQMQNVASDLKTQIHRPTNQSLALPFRDSHQESVSRSSSLSSPQVPDSQLHSQTKEDAWQRHSSVLQTQSNGSSFSVGQNGKKLPPPSLNSLTTYSNPSEGELSFIGLTASAAQVSMQLDEFDTGDYQFAEELAYKLVRRSVISRGHSQIRKCPASRNSSASSTTAPETSHTSHHRTGSVPTGKRSLRDDEDEDRSNLPDRDRKDDREPHPKRLRGKEGPSARLFACPYAKFDPERYSEQNQNEKHYRKCASKYLVNITRVKQHLYRTHMRPPWYCGNCYEDFKTRDELHEHTRMRPPCDQHPSLYEEKMTDEQYRLIKRRSQGNTDRESWYRIFRVLFPNASRPLSPYVSTSDTVAVQHFVALFRWYGPEEFMNVLQSRRDRNGALPLEVSTQAVVDEAFEIALPEFLDQIGRDQQSQSRPKPGSILEEQPYDDNFSFVASVDGEEDINAANNPAPEAVIVQLDSTPSIPCHSFGLGIHDRTFSESREPATGTLVPVPVPPAWPFDSSEVNHAFGAYNVLSDFDFTGEAWIDIGQEDPAEQIYSVS